MSWSLSSALIDILLGIFLAPEQSICTYPGPDCQNPPSVSFQRSVLEDVDSHRNVLLKCDRHNLATLNDTLCADVLSSRVGRSASVLTLCQALSSLSPGQVERVWSNMCYSVQAVLTPLLSRSPECAPPAPSAGTPAPARFPREASNLKQLACNYNSWLENDMVDAVLVSLCGDNEREEFVKRVCDNAPLMKKLLSDQMNSWLYAYCSNASAQPGYLVAEFCSYGQWIEQTSVPVDPALLEMCMTLDAARLTQLICEHTGLYMLLFSVPQNAHLLPNCTNLTPVLPHPDTGSLTLDTCRYSEWHDVMQVTIDVLSQCIRLDNDGFTRQVCSNQTFLNVLLRNEANFWLESHCNVSLSRPTTESPEAFSIQGWCDYQTWAERQVDDSVVGLCWQYDQVAFYKNVCCQAAVFEKLLEDPRNKWLTSICTDMDELEDPTVLPQVIRSIKTIFVVG